MQNQMSNLAPTRSYALPTKEVRRIQRFLVVGVSSTVLDFLLLSLFKGAGATTLVANTLAFSLATIYNFFVSRHWTYAGERHKQVGLQFTQYVVASLLQLVLNDAIVLLLETPLRNVLGGSTWSYLPAKLVATVAVAILSFVLNRIWVFNDIDTSYNKGERK